MREFNIDEILLEANYRSEKGYIDLDVIKDIQLIENTMYEIGYSSNIIIEFINNIKEANAKNDVSNIKDTLADIIEEYHKIMKVFYYFDPNSLGTISETVLTELLNQYSGEKSFPYLASHTGAANKLTDIALQNIDDKDKIIKISLKTTLDNEARIGLGYSKYITAFDWQKYFKNLESLQAFFKNEIENKTFTSIKSKHEKKYPDLVGFFESRISSTIYKLSEIAFFWSAINSKKTKDSKHKVLNGFTFIIGNFNKTSLTNFLMNECKIYFGKNLPDGNMVEFSWGLKTLDDIKVIQTEPPKYNTKYLNISSIFLRNKFITNKENATGASNQKIQIKSYNDADLGKFNVIKANLNISADALKNSNIGSDVKRNLIQILLKNIDKI